MAHLDPQTVKRTVGRRTRAGLGVFGIGAVAATVCMAVLSPLVGPAESDWRATLIPLTGLVVLVGSAAAADWCVRPYQVRCPLCDAGLSTQTSKLLATRRCPECDRHVVQGRPRSSAAWQRRQHAASRALVARWLWTWPLLAASALVIQWFRPAALADCPGCYLIAAVLGVATSAWAWLRTGDRRYAAPLVASTVAALIGGAAFT